MIGDVNSGKGSDAQRNRGRPEQGVRGCGNPPPLRALCMPALALWGFME